MDPPPRHACLAYDPRPVLLIRRAPGERSENVSRWQPFFTVRPSADGANFIFQF
ncbi:hypothetical protein BLAT2472_50078 [Burkholderia latens]